MSTGGAALPYSVFSVGLYGIVGGITKLQVRKMSLISVGFSTDYELAPPCVIIMLFLLVQLVNTFFVVRKSPITIRKEVIKRCVNVSERKTMKPLLSSKMDISSCIIIIGCQQA